MFLETTHRYVHGSANSLDLDVIYVLKQRPSAHNAKLFCSASAEENRNVVTVKNGTVDWCYKGSIDEVNNALLETYHHHPQQSDLCIKQRVKRDLARKGFRLLRGLLGYHSRTEHRTLVKAALRSGILQEKLDALRTVMLIHPSADLGKTSKTEFSKFCAFQYAQFFGLNDGIEIYTKDDAARHYPMFSDALQRNCVNVDDALLQFTKTFIELLSRYTKTQTGNCVRVRDTWFDLRKEEYVDDAS